MIGLYLHWPWGSMRVPDHERRKGLTTHKSWRWRALLLVVILMLGSGCTRRYFRKDADREVECVISSKNCSDRWRVENFWVYPHPLARFADPTHPDRPPMPPDDPAARQLSPNPQRSPRGRAVLESFGYMDLLASWDAENRGQTNPAPATEQPIKQAQFQPVISGEEAKYEIGLKTKEQPFKIKLEQASELGLINSREYQDRREDLYLAALPVTLERFAFAPHFFAIEEIIREYTGRE